jgi:sensor histidine kinase YesM
MLLPGGDCSINSNLQLERSEKEREVAELQQQKTELEMQALRAQMNPHFILIRSTLSTVSFCKTTKPRLLNI